MANYLINESPLVLLPTLAAKIGLNEAIVLQQVQYWLNGSKHEHDGRKWIYNTYEDWQEQFPFWSVRTIRRAINSLEETGALLTTNKYNKLPIDKTKWYSIDYNKLQEIMNSDTTGQNDQSSGQDGQSDEDNLADPPGQDDQTYHDTTAETSDQDKEIDSDQPTPLSEDTTNAPGSGAEEGGQGKGNETAHQTMPKLDEQSREEDSTPPKKQKQTRQPRSQTIVTRTSRTSMPRRPATKVRSHAEVIKQVREARGEKVELDSRGNLKTISGPERSDGPMIGYDGEPYENLQFDPENPHHKRITEAFSNRKHKFKSAEERDIFAQCEVHLQALEYGEPFFELVMGFRDEGKLNRGGLEFLCKYMMSPWPGAKEGTALAINQYDRWLEAGLIGPKKTNGGGKPRAKTQHAEDKLKWASSDTWTTYEREQAAQQQGSVPATN